MRQDLPQLVRHATARGIYANLITAAVLLSEAKLQELAAAGLGHVQVSIQGATSETADRIGHYKQGHDKKLSIARMVPQAGMSLTINAVMHRQNLQELPAVIDLAVALGADRLEVAHVQYHGWAFRNRAALMPTREQFEEADRLVAERRQSLQGQLVIDYVVPDYYAHFPKTCMGGWGQKIVNIAPDGRVLPCHAATTIPGLVFDQVGERGLRDIWEHGQAFTRFRGTGWMEEPCASCPMQEIDWGGCRCQALAITGNAAATDPVCRFSPYHAQMNAMAQAEAKADVRDFIYRHF